LGLLDDWLQVKGSNDHISGGLSLKKRVVVVLLIGFVGAWWFYYKLGVSSVGIPLSQALDLGIFFIPFFMLVTFALFSGAVIDGIDGLAGGVMAIIFASYAWIAFFQYQIDLAAFCATIVGGILAFLWFNIPPARFYMSETGILGLILTLSIVAFMTDTKVSGHGVSALFFIAMPLWVTSLSVVIQVLSKKFRHGKKVFKIAPLHHHFEAIGWPAYKVTMRYWVLSMIVAVLGLIVALSR
jgi:phospho-N-acetylmuramoyl-pentapeptide-transferase